MGVHGFTKAQKYVLITSNFLLFLAGIASVVIGVWSIALRYGTKKISLITDNPVYVSLSIAVIFGGSLISVNALLGCIGAINENKNHLAVYIVALLLNLLLFITTTAFVFVYKNELREKLNVHLERTLISRYGIETSGRDAITDIWDDIQQDLQCCGVEGGLTSRKSWYLWQTSQWFRKKGDGFFYVPESCCNPKYILRQCQLLNSTKSSNQPIQANYTLVSHENPAIFSTGCLDKIIEIINRSMELISGILVGILGVTFFCFLLSLSLRTSIRSGKMEIE